MKLLVGGSSGLVGSALCRALKRRGDDVVVLRRDAADNDRTMSWDAQTFELNEAARLSDIDGVIHLGGESILGRWTTSKKARIRASRVDSTCQLARQMAEAVTPPPFFLTASAIGYYGPRGDEELTEDSRAGAGFLADVCQAWEQAATPVQAVGTRVVHLRFGMLLAAHGGALKTMRTPFQWGLGGKIGTGAQYMSWATLTDAVRAILFTLDTAELAGPVNVVAPNPCTNLDFTKALGRVLHRPTFATVPAPLARLAMGEMAEALLLSSQRVIPHRLQQAGFTFDHAQLEPALADMLQSASS